MTAVDVDALDKLREELAAALADSRPWNEPWADLPEKLREQFRITADTLLPVVDRIANERAAAAEQRGYERGRREVAEYLNRVSQEARRAKALRESTS